MPELEDDGFTVNSLRVRSAVVTPSRGARRRSFRSEESRACDCPAPATLVRRAPLSSFFASGRSSLYILRNRSRDPFIFRAIISPPAEPRRPPFSAILLRAAPAALQNNYPRPYDCQPTPRPPRPPQKFMARSPSLTAIFLAINEIVPARRLSGCRESQLPFQSRISKLDRSRDDFHNTLCSSPLEVSGQKMAMNFEVPDGSQDRADASTRDV